MSSRAKDVLVPALQVAVPLRIVELQMMDEPIREIRIRSWARSAVEPVASRGDLLLYRGGRRGDTAEVFNHLAAGLAALAHCPGGVEFLGVHWCLDHSMGITSARPMQDPALTPACRFGTRGDVATAVEWATPSAQYL